MKLWHLVVTSTGDRESRGCAVSLTPAPSKMKVVVICQRGHVSKSFILPAHMVLPFRLTCAVLCILENRYRRYPSAL
uniref:hypothetical protein n=1 Tax=Klebsiella TaxID=570 RepID=UPI00155DA034|nr:MULTISPECIES: hypothetical protein [Klebsiella]